MSNEHYHDNVPQSIVGDKKMLKYRRRVLSDRIGKESPKWLRIKTVSLLGTLGIGVFCTLFMDFGEQEHVFTPIRRWYQQKKQEFFQLSEDDMQELKHRQQSS